ncbi:MAG: UDP-N-acetylmuramoyl-tripeptide--D-alanyl-D-alanine ligase [Planctomycetaceae bacterium]
MSQLVAAATWLLLAMEGVTLQEVASAIGGQAIGIVRPETVVSGVAIDSRSVRPGELFWALRGEKHDGHDFANEAIRRGASAAVVQSEQPTHKIPAIPAIAVPDTLRALSEFAGWHRKRQEALIVGVTGSFGKTTTRAMIHAVLSAGFPGTQSPKNYNNHLGVPLSLLEIERRHEFAVLEFGASGIGEIETLSRIAAPEVGVVTGIAPAHLERFGGIENIILAKGELLESLPVGGFAILPGDDPITSGMARRAACPAIFIGEREHNDLRAIDIAIRNGRISFTADGHRYQLHATGRHHVQAALIALAIGREVGMSPADMERGLEIFQSVPGRCVTERIGRWTVIDDTYNANPASMRAACDTLRDWRTAGRKLLVAGDMLELGTEATARHRALGRYAAACGIDRIAVHGIHAGEVIRGCLEQGMSADRLAECQDIDVLLMTLDCWLDDTAVLLVKGSRGMRMERVIEHWKEQARQSNRRAA